MSIYLLRHGDALELGFEDLYRPLSPLGERQARIAGKYLKSRTSPPRTVFASPYLRAKQTAELIADSLGTGEIIVTKNLVPGFNDRFLLDEIQLHSPGPALLVGHEPQLRSFVTFLTGERPDRLDLRNGTLVRIEFRDAGERVNGKLGKVVSNEEMELLTAGG